MSKITFNCGMAGKGHNGENPTWLGRSWGYWIPRFRWNGGYWAKDECVDISIQWLCFWVGLIKWRMED